MTANALGGVSCALMTVLLLAVGCGEAPEQGGPAKANGAAGDKAELKIPETKEERPEPRAARDTDWFEDVTKKSGVLAVYRNGREGQHFTVLETLGGGVAMLDYDRDGDLDLFFTGGGEIGQNPMAVTGLPSRLYRNDGDWKFVDVTKEAGFDRAPDYSHGAFVGDYNRDGFPDLFVTCYGRSRLYRNTGMGTFTDDTEEAGLKIEGWSVPAAWADFDRDGWPDLYVGQYLQWKPDAADICGDHDRRLRDICIPQKYPPAREYVFRNKQDGTFEDVTSQAGLQDKSIALGAVVADLNDDGWLDLYVANDVMRNYLYLSGEGFHFQETAIPSGVAFSEYGAPEGSMGVDVGDYDGDRRPDIFVTNYQLEENDLYQNRRPGGFIHATVRTKLAGRARPYVKWGTGLVDFDSDGWLDLFIINGHVLYHTGVSPYLQPQLLYKNEGGQKFVDVSDAAAPYFGVPQSGRGAAAGDLDNDGAMDLVVVHQNEPAVLLRNRKTPANWIRLELQGKQSDPLAIGAVVSVKFGERELTRVVRGGGSYLSQGDLRVLVPVEGEEPPEVTVRWPHSGRESYQGLKLQQTNPLVEGAGESR